MKKIIIKSKKLKEVINITSQIENLLKKFPAEDGMLHLYLRHSTAALTTAYLEGDLDLEMLGEFQSTALVELNGPRKREILIDYAKKQR